MKKYQYKQPYIRIVFLQGKDIVMESPNENADDMSAWNKDWFKSNG